MTGKDTVTEDALVSRLMDQIASRAANDLRNPHPSLFDGVLRGVLEDRGVFFAYLSGPLSWFDSAFVVRPDTRHIVMFGIFLTNTMVDAFFLFPLIIFFKRYFERYFVGIA